MIRAAVKRLSFLLLTTLMLCACNDVYHNFCSTKGEWKRNDTLRFEFFAPNDSKEKYYDARVEIRCTAEYPYKDLWMRIEADSKGYSSPYVDTLHCDIFDEAGRHNGATAGTLYQLSFPISSIPAAYGDTLDISIIHIMDDEILKGVRDVGIRLSHPCQRQSSRN